jgi:hypothetical protein
VRLRVLAVGLVVAALAALAWRSQLVPVVHRPGPPQPLALAVAGERDPVRFDAVLPVAPVGERRVTPRGRPLIVHYWAPWERNGRAQIRLLDSLARAPGLEELDVVVVCSDPYPSVARFVARQRVRVTVVLDGRGDLKAQLPCPSVPYTWLLDRRGRVAARLAGEVDWFAPATRAALDSLLAEPEAEPEPAGVEGEAAGGRVTFEPPGTRTTCAPHPQSTAPAG